MTLPEPPLISYEEALSLIQRHAQPPATETLPLADCAGRALAADITARIASPPFNKAAMDGYAVRSEDVRRLPAELEKIGDSFAGGWPEFQIRPGQCCGIATGAPVPEGADLVVRIEHTTTQPDGQIRIEKLSGGNICPAGEDFAFGQTVLRAGCILSPLHIGVAASAGHAHLSVYQKPSIALLCTGTEIVDSPREPRPGQIYNSNGPMLRALLEPFSRAFNDMGIVEDSPPALLTAIRRGLESDLLVITGGVSVGPFDLVPHILEKADVRIVFHQCAIKPGKPVLFGVFERAGRKSCVFGLPGNPLSCCIMHHVLLRPAIARLSGSDEATPVYRTGVARKGVSNKSGRRHFRPCRIEQIGGVCYVEPAASHGSADIMSAADIRAYMVIPPETKEIPEGREVLFFET